LISFFFQKFRSLVILLNLKGMLPSVQLDYQLFFNTNKIDNIFTNPILTSKFPSSQFPISEVSPQPIFGIGLIFSEGAGKLFCAYFLAPLTLTLSPQGERE
jgi:hypothetical protein